MWKQWQKEKAWAEDKRQADQAMLTVDTLKADRQARVQSGAPEATGAERRWAHSGLHDQEVALNKGQPLSSETVWAESILLP